MTLQLHRPDSEGGLTPRTSSEQPADWRTQLQASRWGARLAGGRLPKLANPEMNPTSVLRSVLFWVVLAGATFAILVVGYGSGFWVLPVRPG